MDKARNQLRSISWRYFLAHVENVNRSVTGVIDRIGHWIVGLVSVQENRLPIDCLLRGHHVHGGFAGHILGDVNTSR